MVAALLPAERQPLVAATVNEITSSYHAVAPLTFGVPLAEGVVDDTAALRVWRQDDGAALPAQARTLTRWPDGSVRWALIDTRLELQAREQLPIVVGLADDIAVTEPAGPRPELPDLRAVLVDRFEHEYESEIEQTEVLEEGPLRTVVRLRGRHRPTEERESGFDFHTFTAHVHLYPGLGRARVEWTLENTTLRNPPGRLAFRSYVLQHPDPGAVDVDLPSGHVLEPQGVHMLQSGPGRGAWRIEVDGRVTPAPRKGKDLWMGLLGDDGDLWAHVEDSAANHPAALSWSSGGPLEFGLLPSESNAEYFLDPGTRKTWRLTLVRGAGRGGRTLMTAAGGRPHVALDPADVAASGAWGDAGFLYVPSEIEMRTDIRLPSSPSGWTDWGEFRTKNTHTSGSPRNQLSVFLEAIQSGRSDLFDITLARAYHAMDLRPYHLEGFSADDWPDANLWEGTPWKSTTADQLGWSSMDERFTKYKDGLPEGGHGYNGFDPGHMTLDDVYEAYLLTGSWPAFDALRSAGEAMLTWSTVVPEGDLRTSRMIGWTLRALVQVHRATGEQRYLDAAARMVRRADEERGKGDVKYLRRGRIDPRHLADQESEQPWMVAVAIHGLGAYWTETRDPIVPPMVADLVTFIMSSYQGHGFASDMAVDDPDFVGEVYQPLGLSQWIPGALAVAARITGDGGPVDAVFEYYRQMHAHSSRPLAFASPTWHWWQPYLVSLAERHGEGAVRSPGNFAMPGASPTR